MRASTDPVSHITRHAQPHTPSDLAPLGHLPQEVEEGLALLGTAHRTLTSPTHPQPHSIQHAPRFARHIRSPRMFGDCAADRFPASHPTAHPLTPDP